MNAPRGRVWQVPAVVLTSWRENACGAPEGRLKRNRSTPLEFATAPVLKPR
jgi:hypothetical protein